MVRLRDEKGAMLVLRLRPGQVRTLPERAGWHRVGCGGLIPTLDPQAQATGCGGERRIDAMLGIVGSTRSLSFEVAGKLMEFSVDAGSWWRQCSR